MQTKMSKQFGLIIPNKNKADSVKPTVLAKSSIFDEESDSDDEASKKPTGLKQALKKQDRVLQEKAMEEDPTIFQYDEVYDDIDEKRKQSKLARKDIDRKPKYISKLLEAAERRKRENERRIEREVQKERDAEGEEFKDKESFVTSAYRKKLEEMKEMEEQEKREEYLESIGDVRKQGNLDGFYRHLYDQKVNYGENSKDVNKETVSKIEEDPDLNKQMATPDSIKTSNKHQSQSPSREKSNSSPDKPKKRSITETSELTTVPDRKKRKYRDRKQSGLDSSDEDKLEATTVETTKHIQSNLDADSDFSIDSSSDDDEEKERDNKNYNSSIEILNKSTNVKSSEMSDKNINTAEKGLIGNNEVNSSENKDSDEKVSKTEEVEKKPKIDIWKKRTIGVVFEEALQRYFQRKAIRESNQL